MNDPVIRNIQVRRWHRVSLLYLRKNMIVSGAEMIYICSPGTRTANGTATGLIDKSIALHSSPYFPPILFFTSQGYPIWKLYFGSRVLYTAGQGRAPYIYWIPACFIMCWLLVDNFPQSFFFFYFILLYISYIIYSYFHSFIRNIICTDIEYFTLYVK